MNILVIGANGQVGWELVRSLRLLGHVVPVTRGEQLTSAGKSLNLDLHDTDATRYLVRAVSPDPIVNAAAHTAVDKAESEPELAMALNGIAPGVLAEEARRLGAALIHYSTDYVFDGSGNTPWKESDATGPLNVYGRSKLAGEAAIQASGVPHLILRTSWVYGVHGHNFVKTMLRLGAQKPALSIVADQVGAPTSARVIAETTARIVARSRNHIEEMFAEHGGVKHLACGGATHWHGFATKIFELARQTGAPLQVETVKPIPTSDYPVPAQRPLNSRLDCTRLQADWELELPAWDVALADTFPLLYQTYAETLVEKSPQIISLPNAASTAAPATRQRRAGA